MPFRRPGDRRTEALRGAFPRPGGLDLAVAGRRRGHQRVQQTTRGERNLVDRTLEAFSQSLKDLREEGVV